MKVGRHYETKWLNLGLAKSNLFINIHHLFLNPPMPYSIISYMHLIVGLHHARMHNWIQFALTNPSQDKHFFTRVAQVPKQIFKTFIHVGKMVTPIGIDIEMLQYAYNMVWPRVFSVNVNEEVLVVNKDYVVYQIDLFPIVEPSLMHHIIPQLTNLPQGSINEPNAT